MLMLPLLPQEALTCVSLNCRIAGSEIVAAVDDVQLFASEIVTE